MVENWSQGTGFVFKTKQIKTTKKKRTQKQHKTKTKQTNTCFTHNRRSTPKFLFNVNAISYTPRRTHLLTLFSGMKQLLFRQCIKTRTMRQIYSIFAVDTPTASTYLTPQNVDNVFLFESLHLYTWHELFLQANQRSQIYTIDCCIKKKVMELIDY